ncbi:UNVERIFIED_CONTAM: A-kinase anchor protein 1, mitochondrial [Gekko kuhli]
MDSVDSGCQNLGAESNKTELVIWEIEVPKHLVGRLIGKQGRYVSFLKQASGAKIYISTVSYAQDFQICHIEGSQQNVDKALSLIGKKFKDLSLTNIYALPPPTLPLHSLPMTSWLMLPDGVTVEVIVVNQVNAGHLFVQQHTHPTFHVLRSLDEQMYLCYSQPGIPTMPTPVEVGVVCAAPGVDGAWWRAQVVGYFKDSGEVEIRYVDYGGYERVKIDALRQIRSDFVTLPFQGAEVLLDNIVPLPDEDHFSSEADTAVSEMTRGTPLLAQVTNYDTVTGLPLIQLWSMMGDELVSINRTMVERGFAKWIESY